MFTLEDLERKMVEKIGAEEAQKLNSKADLAIKLQRARTAQGLTQSELARRSGLKQSAIARLETQGTAPRIDTLYKVAHALGMEIDLVPRGGAGSTGHMDIGCRLQSLESIIKEQSRELRLVRLQVGLLRTLQVSEISKTRDRYQYEPRWNSSNNRNSYSTNLLKTAGWINPESFADTRRNLPEIIRKGMMPDE